jgi:type 1 glutamine amidotransferase
MPGSTSHAEVLIVWGGLAVHEPEATSRIVAEMLRDEGLSVDMTDDQSALGDPSLHQRRLIVPNITGGSIEPEPLANLMGAVRNGVGLGGHHGALSTSFRSQFDFHYMTGCQWVQHPGDIRDYRVDIIRPDDPIVTGIDSFPYRSEQYYLLIDPSVEVLATTTFDAASDPAAAGTVMPVIYKRRFGKGRVFYSSLGHTAAEFEHMPMRTMLRRGLLWAARR